MIKAKSEEFDVSSELIMSETEVARFNESELEMPRAKSRSLAVSVSYRLTRVATRLFGKDRILRVLLHTSWLSWRLAFEVSSDVYGDEFYDNTRAVSDNLLRRSIPENGSFIDIGCGYGYWCRIAAKYAKCVVGMDFDEGKITTAREITKAANIEYRVGDVFLGVQDEKFDTALLSHVLEHLENPGVFLNNLAGTAKKVIVEVPDFENDPLNWVRVRQQCRFYTDGDHVREYTLPSLIKQLEQNGWQVIEYERRNGSMFVVATTLNTF